MIDVEDLEKFFKIYWKGSIWKIFHQRFSRDFLVRVWIRILSSSRIALHVHARVTTSLKYLSAIYLLRSRLAKRH